MSSSHSEGAAAVALPLPLSAREVPQPSPTATAWIIDAAGGLTEVDTAGTGEPCRLPGGRHAAEISYGADGTLWALPSGGTDPPSVLRQDHGTGFRWVPTPVAPRRIAGGPDGSLWMLSEDGEVLSLTPEGAARRHSPAGEAVATEISAATDGSVWTLTTTRRYGGRSVRRLDPMGGTWFDLPAPAAATKISVGPDGMAWSVNAQGAVWRLHPAGGGSLAECQFDTACSECRFSQTAQEVRDISVGPDGSVWVLAVDRDSGVLELMWLADPRSRRYEGVPTPRAPVRVAASAPTGR